MSYLDTTVNGIVFCLKNEQELKQRAEFGNMDHSIDVVLDSKSIITKANLTPVQRTILFLRYSQHLTLKECGAILKKSFQAIEQSEKLALVKIQKVIDQLNENEKGSY